MTTSRAARMAIAAGATGWAGFSGSSEMLRALISQASVGTLRPQRQGASEQSLRDTVGTRTDSGSPLYRYTDLAVDPGVLAGDTVGVPYGYNAISGGAVPGTVVGVPAILRYSGAGAPEGFAATASDYIDAVPLPATDFTISLHSTIQHSGTSYRSAGVMGANTNDGGLRVYYNNGLFVFNVRSNSSGSGTLRTISHTLTNGTPFVVLLSYAMTGDLVIRLYAGGSFLAAESGSSTPFRYSMALNRLGGPLGSINANPAAFWVGIYSGSLLTTGQMDAVGTGSDTTAGGLRTAQWVGVRTKVNLPGDPAKLIYSQGAGLPVQAVSGA